jgi:type II secretory pathway pseudopilin PulG
MKCRHGFSLVELIVVITVETAVLGLAVGLVGHVMGSQRQSRRNLEYGMAWDALCDQFRRDAHAAAAANTANPRVQELKLPDQTRIVYQALESGIQRQELYDGQVLAQEVYRLRPGFRLQFEAELAAKQALLRLQVYPPAGADGHELSPGQCEAVLGRDRRFVTTP